MAIKNDTPLPLDWKAIRKRALFHARQSGNPEAMVEGIYGPGEVGEKALIDYARDTDASLDWLVKGERPHFKDFNKADETISDLRAYVWTLDRLTVEPSPDAEGKANDEHAIRTLTWQAWKLLETYDETINGSARKVAA